MPFSQEVLSQVSSTEPIKLLPWCISVVVPLHYISKATTTATQQDEGISIVFDPCSTASESEPHGLPVPGPSGVMIPSPVMSPLSVSSMPDIPLGSTPLLGHSFAGLTIPPKGKQDHSPSDSPNHLHVKMTCVTSLEIEVRSKHSSTWGNDHTPDPTPETRTDSEQQQQESPNPSSSLTRGLANPNDEAAAGSSKNTGD